MLHQRSSRITFFENIESLWEKRTYEACTEAYMNVHFCASFIKKNFFPRRKEKGSSNPKQASLLMLKYVCFFQEI